MKIKRMMALGAAAAALSIMPMQGNASSWDNPLKGLKDKGKEYIKGQKQKGKEALERAKASGKDALNGAAKGDSGSKRQSSSNSGDSNVGRTVGNQTTRSTTSGTSYRQKDNSDNTKFNTSASLPEDFEVPASLTSLPIASVHSDYRHIRNQFAEPRTTSATVHLILDYDHDPYFSDFHDGVAYICDDKKAFYIDRQGNVLFETGLRETGDESMPRFSNGVVLEKPNIYSNFKKVRLLDKRGNVIKEFETTLCSHMEDGVGMVVVQKGTKNGSLVEREIRYIDSKGNFVYPNLTSEFSKGLSDVGDITALMRKSSEGLTAFPLYDSNKSIYKWGFRDQNGNIIVEPKYDIVRDFKDGVAAVCIKGTGYRDYKWGFIDKSGREVIPLTYSIMPSDFDSGLSLVLTKNGEAYIIDKRGNKVKGPFNVHNDDEGGLVYISPFFNGYAIMGKTTNVGDKDWPVNYTVYYAVDTNFSPKSWADREALTLNWETPIAASDGYLYVDNGGSWGSRRVACLDPKNMNLKTAFLTNPFVDGLSRYNAKRSESSVGYINEDNEFTIILEKNEF